MLANFHQLSLIGPIANALVLPLLPPIMVIGGAATLIGGVTEGAGWVPMQLAGLIASWFRLVIEALGSLPMAAVVTPYFPSRWLIAAGLINGGALAGIKLRHFFWQRRAWAGLGLAVLIASVLLLLRPDGRVHVYALDVGTGSAVLIRTANGHQILMNAGPDGDRFAEAVGRALPPTARTIDLWLITGIRRPDIGGATTVLNRFGVGAIAVVTQDSWSATLRSLVEQAQANGIPVTTAAGPYLIDGVTLSQAGDGMSWLIQSRSGRVLVVPPQTPWSTIPAGVDGAIFTDGGPSDWQGPAEGFSVIEVDRNSREGLPVRAVVHALSNAPLYRTDRLGSLELVDSNTGFHRVSNP
jgi:beta-lactamase superfamily II metal-dependent hydrolase